MPYEKKRPQYKPKNGANPSGSGWNIYLKSLLDRNIPEKVRPWYVRHLKAFQLFLGKNGQRLDEISAADLEGYLKVKSIEPSLNDWLFRQIIGTKRGRYPLLVPSQG